MGKYLFLLDQEQWNEDLSFLPGGKRPVERQVMSSFASREERLEAVKDAEVIFGEPTMEELRYAQKLCWVQMFWAGADRYQGGGFPKGVRLTTASGAFGETIAEHALAMLFALCRRLPAYGRQRCWKDLGPEKRISGSTALIFGAGDIGGSIARRLKTLGVRTVGVCRSARQPRADFDLLTPLSCGEVFLPEADFIVCALPANGDTAGYFNEERLSLIKDDAVLINVGRGSLIDTNALTETLKKGKFFGVGLDVVAPEPLPEAHPLWNMDNVLLTPHVAGVSFGHDRETEKKIWEICRENLLHYEKGEPLRNEVTLP